jgi:hypothetical protein
MRHYLYFNLDQCTIVLGPSLVPQRFLSFALIEDVATGSETFQHVVEWNCKSFEVQSWWCSCVPVVVLITQLVATPSNNFPLSRCGVELIVGDALRAL